MPFSQATITSVSVTQDGVDLLISWRATAPATFQVYVDRQLTWAGTETSCAVPWPAEPNTPIDVGTVDPGEEEIDFSASLSPAPASHATLSWHGGTYEDEDIAGFRVYQGPSPGAAPDYTKPVAEIVAYPLDIVMDGFGLGEFGGGGFGLAASRYTWRSETLRGGTWNFGIKPFDVAGNEGTVQLASVVIAAPPRPPAARSNGIRITYTYNPTTHICTLAWLASPP